MTYEVSRVSFSGKGRIKTELNFVNFEDAQKYANETNEFYPNAKAKVEMV